MSYILVIILIAGTIFLLSRLKPIGLISNVDWSEYRKCQSKPERLMFQQFAKLNLYVQCQVKIKGRLKSDFYIPRFKTFVEVDGIHHQLPDQQRRDQEKDRIIREEMGLEVIRIEASVVTKSPDEALMIVLKQVKFDEILTPQET